MTGGWQRVCEKLKVDYSFYQDTGSGAVCSVRDRNRRNVQDRSN